MSALGLLYAAFRLDDLLALAGLYDLSTGRLQNGYSAKFPLLGGCFYFCYVTSIEFCGKQSVGPRLFAVTLTLQRAPGRVSRSAAANTNYWVVSADFG